MIEALVSDEQLRRRIEVRRLREAAPPAAVKRRCRHCKRLFVPHPKAATYQRFCSDDHRKEHHRRKRLLPLQTLVVQGRRQESAPRQCEWCGRPLPPPGRTGPLRRYHDSCRVLLCRARKKETPA